MNCYGKTLFFLVGKYSFLIFDTIFIHFLMKKLWLLFGVFFVSVLQAQQTELLTIDGQPVYTTEFKRVFSKNLDLVARENKQSIADYLQLFIDYKLKVKEAEAQGLDTAASFTGEFNIYKSQLAEKYMTDNAENEKLLNEAYERLKKEVNVNYILIQLPRKASPADTLKAYQKINEIWQEAKNGADFEMLTTKYSEDPSVRKNKGNLGWFSVFEMVYSFENAAYQTPVGEISKPFRSQFGYHILKVNGKRENEGKVSVAHIMIENNEENPKEAESQITEIYRKLQEQAEFSDLAKQFSDDKNTAANGGEVNTFNRGDLTSDKFENVAFSLKENGELSKPFKTKYGWHIIKLLQRYPVNPFSKEKRELENKIRSDSRSQLVHQKLLEQLEQDYSVEETQPGLSYFENNALTKLMERKFKASELKNLPKKDLISIKEEAKTYADFATYLEKRQQTVSGNFSKELLLQSWYNDFKNSFLLRYHKAHLAESNEAYAHIIEEYRNGLLLFDLMNKNVWKAAQEDSLALRKQYQTHREQYKTPLFYTGVIASSDKKSTANKIRRKLKQGNSIVVLKKEYPSVIFKEDTFFEESSMIPEGFNGKKGVSNVFESHGLFVVVKIENIEEPKQKSFEDARGEVISDYQKVLEDQFLKNLRKKHSVKVNQKVLKKIENTLE